MVSMSSDSPKAAALVKPREGKTKGYENVVVAVGIAKSDLCEIQPLIVPRWSASSCACLNSAENSVDPCQRMTRK